MAVICWQKTRKQYRRAGQGSTAVDDLSLSLPAGKVFALGGPNGAGKSTAMATAAGLIAPDAGSVEVLGLRPGQDTKDLVEKVGIQSQELRLLRYQTVLAPSVGSPCRRRHRFRNAHHVGG